MSQPVVDLLISYKFSNILSTPWEQMDAYKLGIIDHKGRILKKRSELKTADEQKAYPSVFYTLAWNIKKLIDFTSPCLLGRGVNMVNRPEVFIRGFLLKEFCEKDLMDKKLVERLLSEELDRRGLLHWTMSEETHPTAIEAGEYIIRGQKVTLESQLLPTDEFFGYPIYRIGRMPFTIHDVRSVSEDAPANAAGHGNIAGVSSGQEPPGRRGAYFRRNRKNTAELKNKINL